RFPEKTKREDIVENIRTRYKNNKGLERFHPFLENVDLVVWSDVIYPRLENVDLVVWSGVIYPPLMHQCQQPYQLQQPMNGYCMQQYLAPTQGYVMYPICAPQLQIANLDLSLECPRSYVEPNLDCSAPNYVYYLIPEQSED
ncbi:MAG: hypothetical protein OXC30_05490, partial [Alphaproteobacteria bacterium]|nr:hypothetical protein [Alphaproteobacteria bacterium]